MSPTSKQDIVVIVTGVGGGSVGYELLQALRSASTGYRLIPADASRESLAMHEEPGHVLPPATDPGYLDAALRLCRTEGAQVIIPGSEAELRVLSAQRCQLVDAGVLPLINSESVIATGLSKAATYAFLRTHGYAVPETVELAEPADEDRVGSLPCVVKPVSGTSGSNLVFIAQDRDELAFFARYIRRAGYTPLAQAYVGRPDQEFTVGVLHARDGSLMGSLALRRDILRGLSMRTRVRARGSSARGEVLALSSGISQGTVEDAPAIRATCEAIAGALASRGPLNIQLRYTDGVAYPFEINPRFSGTCHLRALAGFNEADLLIRHELLGEAVEPRAYRTGLALRGLTSKLIP